MSIPPRPPNEFPGTGDVRSLPSSVLRCLLLRLELKFSAPRKLKRAWRSPPPVDESPYLKCGWELDSGEVTIPESYLKNRVHGMSRLVIKPSYAKDEFIHAAEAIQKLSCNCCTVFMRHVKNHDEDPWWDTAAPGRTSGDWDGVIYQARDVDLASEPLACEPYFSLPKPPPDVIQEMVDEARDQGIDLIAYYRHMAECSLAIAHPEWICLAEDGSYAFDSQPQQVQLNLANPGYRDILLVRLKELAGRGVIGFNFDERHMPPDGAWNCELINEFDATLHAAGCSLPAGFDPASGGCAPIVKDFDSLRYRQFLDFIAYKIEETFAFLKREVKRDYPGVAFSISTTSLPSLSNRRMTTNLARIADFAKNEYTLALSPLLSHPLEEKSSRSFLEQNGLAEGDRDIRMALGWTVLRDAADGRPPRIWAPYLPNPAHALGYAASLLTYGAIVNLNINGGRLHDAYTGEHTTGDEYTSAESIRAVFALGNAVSSHLLDTQPLYWAIVHFSETARNRRGGDMVKAWKEVLWPCLGAFGVFVRLKIPLGVVNDYQLEKGDLKGAKVLFLPTPEELSNRQRVEVTRFQREGGIVLTNDSRWPWSDINRTAEAAKKLRETVEKVCRCWPPPVQVFSSMQKIHAMAYQTADRKKLVVVICNDFTDVETRITSDSNSPPPALPVNDAVVVINSKITPHTCTEARNGIPLVPNRIVRGYQIQVPRFQDMALVVINYH